MASKSAPPPDLQRSDSEYDYDYMIEVLDKSVKAITEKIESGRIRDADKEKVRIKWHRALGYMIRTRREVVKDSQLEELQERVSEMEKRQERRDKIRQ